VKAEDEEPLWPSGQVRAGRALANETRSGLVAGRNRRLDDATPRRSGSRALSKFGHSLDHLPSVVIIELRGAAPKSGAGIRGSWANDVH
jgi:hypothetical protein